MALLAVLCKNISPTNHRYLNKSKLIRCPYNLMKDAKKLYLRHHKTSNYVPIDPFHSQCWNKPERKTSYLVLTLHPLQLQTSLHLEAEAGAVAAHDLAAEMTNACSGSEDVFGSGLGMAQIFQRVSVDALSLSHSCLYSCLKKPKKRKINK